jgi:methenyltetrahydromethanopterin cyclohydrolase
MQERQRPSVGRLAAPLVERLVADASRYRVAVSRGPGGARLVDAGAAAPGGLEAGLLIAEICMGGLGHAGLAPNSSTSRWPWTVHVRVADPVLACLGSQYAGWALSAGEGDGAYRAMGSGPARAAAAREPLFEEIGYRDAADANVLVLEAEAPPPESVLREVAEAAGCAPERLTVVYAPTTSLAGSCQVVARVLEVALHKLHALGFPLERVVDGIGSAPIAPPAPVMTATWPASGLSGSLPSFACSIGQYSQSNMSASVIGSKRPMASASVITSTVFSAISAATAASWRSVRAVGFARPSTLRRAHAFTMPRAAPWSPGCSTRMPS